MPVPSLPPLPPRSATEIVDGAVQLVRPHFGYFLRIATVGAIPALVQAVITLLIFPTMPTDPVALLRQQASLLPLTLLTYALTTMQSGAIIIGALAVLRGDPLPSVWTAFTSALRRLFSLLGANLLLAVMLVIVMIPVIAAAVFVAVTSTTTVGSLLPTGTGVAIAAFVGSAAALLLLFFAFLTIFARSAIMTSLVIAEGLGPIQSLRRAHALSSGSYLRLAQTYGLVFVILIVIYGVLAGVAIAFQGQQQLVQALLSVILIPVIPIIGSIMLLTYADLRVRREGADLDAALDAMAPMAASAS